VTSRPRARAAPALPRLGRVLLPLWALLFAGAQALQETTTRGSVTDASDAPLAGADVLLADSAGVIAWRRTDAEGRFVFVHPPLDREGHQLLICARGRAAMRLSPAGSALLGSSYGLDLGPHASSWTPERLGWKLPVAPSCPGAAASAAGPLTLLRRDSFMDTLLETVGAVGFLLLVVLVYLAPLVIVVWLVRTLASMRRDQARLVALVESIETEMRTRAARKLRGPRPDRP